MLRIGLTGGIGSGKSTVARMFAARDVPVIDTDQLARDVALPGQPAYTEIVSHFGHGILEPTGNLDRAKLRARVFADVGERKRLEAILHPRIRDAMQQRLEEIVGPYAVIAVPLLVETGFGGSVDRVLVVDCSEALQIERTAARSGMTLAEINRVMSAQATRQERRAEADDVIDNSSDLAHLERQVAQLHERYLALARA